MSSYGYGVKHMQVYLRKYLAESHGKNWKKMYVFSGDYYARSYLMIILVFSCSYHSVCSTDTKDVMPKITKNGSRPPSQPRSEPKVSNCSEENALSGSIYLPDGYLRADQPLSIRVGGKWVEKDSISVNAQSEILSIKDVDDKKQTITADILVHLQWRDDRIIVNPPPGKKVGLIGIWNILDSNQIHKIWNPDLTIYKMTHLKRLSILNPSNGFLKIHADRKLEKVLVDYEFEAEITVSCNFHYGNYPMDMQHCELRMGSTSYGRHIEFTLWSQDPGVDYQRELSNPPVQKLEMKGFRIDVLQKTDNFSYCDGKPSEPKMCIRKHLQHVVFDIEMNRFLQPFFMHYYAPCILIILVTHASFIIPPDCIPGRVALLATQFLTLVNIFINQQVNTRGD